MKKILKHKKMIILGLIFLLCIGGVSITLQIKKQKQEQDKKNIHDFAYSYMKITKVLDDNDKKYNNYIKAIDGFVVAHKKNTGNNMIFDVDKKGVVDLTTNYKDKIEELKKLNSSKDLQDQYYELLNMYSTRLDDRNKINNVIANSNTVLSDTSKTLNAENLTKQKQDFLNNVAIALNKNNLKLEDIIKE